MSSEKVVSGSVSLYGVSRSASAILFQQYCTYPSKKKKNLDPSYFFFLEYVLLLLVLPDRTLTLPLPLLLVN